jgi:hypothetical protein
VLVLALVAGLVAVAARQVTVLVRGDQPVGATAPDPAATAAPDGGSDPTGEGGALPTPPVTPPDPGELAPGTGSDPIIGEPSIQPVDRGPVADRVFLLAGSIPNLDAAPPEAAPPQDAGDAVPDGSGQPGSALERPDVGPGELAPPERGFGVGVSAEPDGHYATITVGVSGGPDGLAGLLVDFGDGSSHQLPDGDVARLRARGGGTVTLVHRYEPTLDPQPQRVVATATDGAGQRKRANRPFETQAEFLVGFSALTVRALDDCDLVGKGDFELRWNLDGRDRSSRFDLGKGESYVENKFRIGLNGIHAGSQVDYWLTIAERDSGGKLLTPWEWPFDFRVRGPLALEVVELGAHSYPVTLFWHTEGEDDCHVRLDYTYHVAMPDPPR